MAALSSDALCWEAFHTAYLPTPAVRFASDVGVANGNAALFELSWVWTVRQAPPLRCRSFKQGDGRRAVRFVLSRWSIRAFRLLFQWMDWLPAGFRCDMKVQSSG